MPNRDRLEIPPTLYKAAEPADTSGDVLANPSDFIPNSAGGDEPLNRWFNDIYERLGPFPLKIPAYSVAELQTDSPPRFPAGDHGSVVAGEEFSSLVYVYDESGGATLAFAGGTNWRRVQDRAIIS